MDFYHVSKILNSVKGKVSYIQRRLYLQGGISYLLTLGNENFTEFVSSSLKQVINCKPITAEIVRRHRHIATF